MPVTIEVLNAKYGKEDAAWSFSLFPSWLAKKGFREAIITASLQQALTDFSEDTLPEKHNEFDQYVLGFAKKLSIEGDAAVVRLLQEQLSEGFKKYEADWNSLSKIKKIWEVIRGSA